MNYGRRFVTLYRRQGSRLCPRKRNAKKQNGFLKRPYKWLWKEEKRKAKEKRKDLDEGLELSGRKFQEGSSLPQTSREGDGLVVESVTNGQWFKKSYFCNEAFVLSAKLLQSCLTLCDPMDCSPPGSSVHGISQARILELVSISSSWGSSRPRGWTWVSHIFCIGRKVHYH